MRKPVAVLLAMLSAAILLPAQQKKGGKKKAGEPSPEAQSPQAQLARFAGTIDGERASRADKQSDWPAVACSKDGSLWVIYIEWNDKDADRVLVRRKDPQGRWSEPVELADGNWDHYSPAIAGRASSAVAVWSGQTSGNFDLYWSEITSDGKASRPQRLTTAANSDFNVRAASDAAGNVTIAWQSFRKGNADIYARKLTGAVWWPETPITTWEANDWEPALALDSKGKAWISWDSYRNGNYDVFLRSFDGVLVGDTIPITTEPSAQFHSTVAVDPSDRVWVAWDDGGINWGKDFSRSSSAPGSRGLHYSRTLGMRVYAGGRVHEVMNDAAQRFTGRMQRYAELPYLAFDSSGALCLVFRHWTLTQPHEIYHFYVMRLSGGEWSEPEQLSASSGQNTQRASVAWKPGGGLAIAYSSDGRSPQNLPKDQMHALHYNVYVSAYGSGSMPANANLVTAQLPEPGAASTRRARTTMKAGGKTYMLFFGDCHRHTDIRGHSGVDGSVLDTYRYAIDAAQLDFLGASDHNEVTGGRWPDGLRDYHWWWVQKAVDLMTHGPGFIGLYSYEHSMNRPAGHRNVLFLKRGAPLRPIDRERKSEDNQPPNLWKFWEENVLKQPGQRSVIVPHTFAAGPLADWNWPNARFDCLLEMYQGARGSYEAYRLPEKEKRGPTQVDEAGHYAQDALGKGNTYGFVSFSDHGSTHNSWAGVWVEKQDREGILDAMFARHTFAASDEIIVKASSAGHMPGDEWNAGTKAPRIEAAIEAPDTILRVDVVKDGKYVYTTRPNSVRARLSWRDNEVKSGRSYYYVRVFQRDPENPEGDPEIGWSSPFYVTYR
ncbi:MAG: hypothetical protein HY235_16795 [Acidobacteria bacterium]|nr:hypothetical protein [Acidobacteriota bacterium]